MIDNSREALELALQLRNNPGFGVFQGYLLRLKQGLVDEIAAVPEGVYAIMRREQAMGQLRLVEDLISAEDFFEDVASAINTKLQEQEKV